MNYFARPLNRSETDLDMGRYGRVGVFSRGHGDEKLVGSYLRNYLDLFDTFFHFRIDDQDLALYSPDYTATRIMELPSCQDIGGEESSDEGFCPVEYFIPTYIDQEVVQDSNNEAFPPRSISKNRVNNPNQYNLVERVQEHNYTNLVTGQECTDTITSRPVTPVLYYPFGFVAGCIWGDDSSWKIQFLDLSEARKGILKREERFGYIVLPEDVPLKKAIDMSDFAYDPVDEDAFRINIQIVQTFDLETGKMVHPFD